MFCISYTYGRLTSISVSLGSMSSVFVSCKYPIDICLKVTTTENTVNCFLLTPMSKKFLFCCESVWSTILTTEIKDQFSYGHIRAMMCTLKPTRILISTFLVPQPCFVLTCFLTFLLVWTHSISTLHVEWLHLVFLDVRGFSASLSKLIQVI